MKSSDISKIRLYNQGLTSRPFHSALDCLDHLGAMQAQDFNMVKWAVGIRTKNLPQAQVNQALNEGDIIRTHLLRPTWHLVSSKNIYWMLALSAKQIKAAMQSRNKQLGLTEKIFTKANNTFEKALEKSDCLTRDEMIALLKRAKIDTNDNRASHLFMNAEICGIICSGPLQGIKNTYALLEKRVPKTKTMPREEALLKLAMLYFKSHGPATIQDFIWWSGLSVTEVKKNYQEIDKNLLSIKIEGQTYLMSMETMIPETKKNTIHLLPGYDELLISYKDRSAIITMENHRKAISNNGVFNPIITVDGRAVGTWKSAVNKGITTLTPFFFGKVSPTIKSELLKKMKDYSEFLNQKMRMGAG